MPGAVDEQLAVTGVGDDRRGRARRARSPAGRDGRPRTARAAPPATPRRSDGTPPAARRPRRSASSRSSSPSGIDPPMSTTTGSPAATTRSETSACGLAPFGPDATMTKSALRCPARRIASAMSAPISRSVRPAPQPLAHLGVHRVDRRRRPAQRLDLLGRLADAQLAHHRRGVDLLEPGTARPQRQRAGRPHPLVDGDAAAVAGTSPASVAIESSVSAQPTTGRRGRQRRSPRRAEPPAPARAGAPTRPRRRPGR